MERVELELVGRHALKSYVQMKFLGIYINKKLECLVLLKIFPTQFSILYINL
jgi:hypothetical protein